VSVSERMVTREDIHFKLPPPKSDRLR